MSDARSAPMPGEGLTPEAAAAARAREWAFSANCMGGVSLCASCIFSLARVILAAEARGREAAARWVRLGRWHDPDSCAEGILALATAPPKAAPPADALREALSRLEADLRRIADESEAKAKRADTEGARGVFAGASLAYSFAAERLAAALARSAPPAPAAPICSAEEK